MRDQSIPHFAFHIPPSTFHLRHSAFQVSAASGSERVSISQRTQEASLATARGTDSHSTFSNRYGLSLNLSYSLVCLLDRSTGFPLMNMRLTLVLNSSGSPSVTIRLAILSTSMLPNNSSTPENLGRIYRQGLQRLVLRQAEL